MALVTVVAVVDIAPHAPMLRVGLCLGMAVGAGKDRVVVGVGMAIGADAVRIAMVHVEPGVAECPVGPFDGVMAGFASRWEMRGSVIRVIRIQVVRLMTAVTISWQIRVVIIDVAVCAGARRHHV